jgi:hypothetical protein
MSVSTCFRLTKLNDVIILTALIPMAYAAEELTDLNTDN